MGGFAGRNNTDRLLVGTGMDHRPSNDAGEWRVWSPAEYDRAASDDVARMYGVAMKSVTNTQSEPFSSSTWDSGLQALIKLV